MAMGRRERDRQPSMWVATTDLPTAASHPFYTRCICGELASDPSFRAYGGEEYVRTFLSARCLAEGVYTAHD